MATDRRRVEHKVAIVTGAGSGIGRATAMLLAAEGAQVVLADIDFQSAQACVDEITGQGGSATATTLDVTDEQAWRHVFELVDDMHSRLDILVNNAGISLSKPLCESTLEDWRKGFAVNLDGTFLGTKHAASMMRQTGGGSIVNVASVSGMTPSAGASAYCTSKAAVRMFSKIAAIECADEGTGVRVNLVTPGGVKTPMWEKEAFFQELMAEHGGREAAFTALSGTVPSQQFFTPHEVAQTILYLASDESAHLSGVEIVLDRGHSG